MDFKLEEDDYAGIRKLALFQTDGVDPEKMQKYIDKNYSLTIRELLRKLREDRPDCFVEMHEAEDILEEAVFNLAEADYFNDVVPQSNEE